jgi:hypothetical protein
LKTINFENPGNLKIISVANPASFVPGHGPYTTLKSDGIITSIPDSLTANVRNDPYGKFDHEFVRHYLEGNNSSRQISYQIYKVLNETDENEADFGNIGYFNEDLQAVWIKSLELLENKNILSKSQCAIIRTIATFREVWGLDCSDRNLDLMRKKLQGCMDQIIKHDLEGGKPTYCPFAGGLVSDGLDMMNKHRMPNLEKHSECEFEASSYKNFFSSQDFQDALNLISTFK